MKLILFAVACCLSATSFAQNVYVIDNVKSQPLVYRNDSGGFKGCGIRTVFLTDVPRSSHVGDISVNVFKQDSGKVVGLVKIIYSKIGNLNDPNSTTNIPLSKFMFASTSGQALRLGDIQPGEVPNSYLTQSSAADAMQYLTDAIGGKVTQVGVTFKSEASTMRIFSLKNTPLSQDEMAPLATCMKQLGGK
jgi:hypothetical protein